MADLPTLDALPGQYGALAAGFRRAAAGLIATAVPGWLDLRQAAPSLVLARRAEVRSRFYLTMEGSEVFFFFVRRDTGPRMVLDARVGFQIAPAVLEGKPPRMLPEAIAHFVVVPPFWSDAGWPQEGAGVPALLALAGRIGEWVAAGFESGEERPLDLSRVAGTPVIHEMFHRICEAWSEAYNGAASEGTSSMEALLPDFEVRDFTGSVLLRLKADGCVAKDDADDPFQLLLTIRIGMDGGLPRSRISIGPPDFLVSGRLRDAFVAGLAEGKALAETAAQLGLDGTEELARLHSFLLSASATALVFRVKRGRPDTDLVVYTGDWAGRQETLAVRADFEVDTAAAQPVTYVSGSQRAAYFSAFSDGTIGPREDLARYCARLRTLLETWMGLWAGDKSDIAPD